MKKTNVMSTLLNGGEVSNLNQRQTVKYQKCCDAVGEHEEKIRDLTEKLHETKSLVAEFKEEMAAAKEELRAKRDAQQAIASNLRQQLAAKKSSRR